jgi:hypothetical protein
MVGSAPGDDTDKLVHLGAHIVHLLLTLEHVLLHERWILWRGLNLLESFLLPLFVGFLKAMHAIDLAGPLNHGQQSVEFGINLMVRFVQGLEKGGIADEKIAAQAGLFIDDQFDETICVEDDYVGAVDCIGALLNPAQAVSKDESKGSERCNRKNQETKQEPAIEPRFQKNASREVELSLVSCPGY